jgi:hypothetical protein
MKKITYTLLYIIFTLFYIDNILFDLINARDTSVNYLALISIVVYLYITSKFINFIIKTNKKENEKVN